MLYIKQSVRVANTETFQPQKRGVHRVQPKQGLKYLNGRFYFCIKVFSKKYLIYGYFSFNFFYVSVFLWIAHAYFAIDISDT